MDLEFPSFNDSSMKRHRKAVRQQVGLAPDSVIASSENSSADECSGFDEGVTQSVVMNQSCSTGKMAIPTQSAAANRVPLTETILNHENRMQNRNGLKLHKRVST